MGNNFKKKNPIKGRLLAKKRERFRL